MSETIHIRPMAPIDAHWWREHRAILYGGIAQDIDDDVARYFGGGLPGVDAALLAELGTTRIGFAELSIRAFAEGCHSENVGYVEGWYVVESHREQHVGHALIEAAEQWARHHGCKELASDTPIDNEASTRAHLACGFEATGRIVTFRKPLA